MIETSKIYKYKTKKRNFRKCRKNQKLKLAHKKNYLASGDAEKCFQKHEKKKIVKQYGK